MGFEHTSVMPKEVQGYQNLKPGDICVDCTLGGSGHALSTLGAILPHGRLIGIDQDLDAIDHAQKVFQPFQENVLLVHSNFSALPQILKSNGIEGVNAIVLDLGFSLHQMKNSNRGFSFTQNEPLDMRMDVRNPLTAGQIVNTYKEQDLIDIFFKYGEERFARRITAGIVKNRAIKPIETGKQLAGIVVDAVPAKQAFGQKIHPATRIFQALRIAVNNELALLENFMERLPDLLVQGGRICVISFHSLEDRIIKHSFNKFEKGCTCPKALHECLCGFVPRMKLVFKKPVVPTPGEICSNPMARSAKLRVAQRV